MDRKIDPDLFARLMRLSSGPRMDLLEYFGQTPLAPEEVVRISEAALADNRAGTRTKATERVNLRH